MRQFIVEVWGDFACFTRPEAKVERFTYPVITPSAARGVLDAIYVKPIEFGWRIDKIEVLNPLKYIALKRNEVKEKIPSISNSIVEKGGDFALIAADATGNDAKGRTQRQTIALKDVHYRIYAHIRPRKGFENKRYALEEQAARRIKSGKCFYQPYLGCREFVAYFKLADEISDKPAVKLDMDIGYMLYDVFDLDKVYIGDAAPYISLFHAVIENGVIEIPDWESSLVQKPVRR
jgi:CRISPR-associated protein Cas5d